jgi:hypothetical protein
MDAYTIRHTAYYGIVLVGASHLLIAAFTAAGRSRPRWVRLGLFMASPAAIAWSLAGFTRLFFWQHITRDVYSRLDHYGTLLEGIGGGILTLLLLSGELCCCFRRSPRTPRS